MLNFLINLIFYEVPRISNTKLCVKLRARKYVFLILCDEIESFYKKMHRYKTFTGLTNRKRFNIKLTNRKLPGKFPSKAQNTQFN